MSVGLDEFLASFDQLSETEQQRAANEIWRRLQARSYDPVSPDAMLEIADMRFQRLDEEEERIGKPQTW
jgi:hypothetical protein